MAEGGKVRSGIPALDLVLQGLQLGDNVVWQVDRLDDYCHFAVPFMRRALEDKRKCVYLRFAPHPPVLKPQPGLKIIELDPAPGFDVFSSAVHKVIEDEGKEAFYVFDNLSALVVDWATDQLLANFFQVTCPFLFELDTVAYFALTRGKHSHAAIGAINSTTQLLIEVYRADNRLYIHPIKVWNRYSNQMFLPHVVNGDEITPVSRSGDAGNVSASAHQHPLGNGVQSIAPWESVYSRLSRYREEAEHGAEDSEFIALKQEF